MPPRTILEKLDGNALTQDTWVEITFADAVTRREVTVRRAMTQKKPGKPTEVVTGLDELRLDPVAFEVGTSCRGCCRTSRSARNPGSERPSRS